MTIWDPALIPSTKIKIANRDNSFLHCYMGCSRAIESLRSAAELFCPERYVTTRALSLYSAAIVFADAQTLDTTQQVCLKHHVTGQQMYEVMLQSYLFLGFPRMLSAAERLARAGITGGGASMQVPIAPSEVQAWMSRGAELCHRVYDSNYLNLKARVEAMAPEVFLWMELEGYGKVLSRPGLDIIDREMAIVACLVADHRPVQLHSHIRGALNVGAPPMMLQDVVSDLKAAAPEGYHSAREIMLKLGLEV